MEKNNLATESTDYSSWRGCGWLDADGPLESGKWPGDKQDTWESRSKLNVVTRRGPDDLARYDEVRDKVIDLILQLYEL